jgi:lysophospholipase L1-like esterase
MAIAHSGRGICRNAGSNIPWEVMTDIYQYTIDRDSTTRWSADQSAFRPDITVIYLGTNDFSSYMMPDFNKFRKGYLRLLSYVKNNYGEDHPVLCVASRTSDYQFMYIRDVVNNCGLKNVHYLGYFPAQHHSTDEDLGAGWHPNYNGQQKIAYSIIPYIATITGWGLQDMPVK